MNLDGRSIKRRALACVVLIGGVTALGAAPARAATLQVSGVQTPVTSGPCFNPSLPPGSSTTMQGSLIGCWYIDTFDAKYQPHSGTLQATGTEHFVGCLDADGDQACDAGDPQGTLSFSYIFTGKLDPLTFAEIRGRCHHPIIAGTGDFAGATGVLDFKDDVTNVISPYRGHVTL